MPLDPNIILQAAQPLPNQPNMLGQYAAVQQIQQNKLAMMAQQQAMALGQVKQQSAQLELSQQQLAATQQQQAIQALKDSNGDVDKASSTLLAAGNQQGLVLQKNKDAISEILAKINQQNSAAAKDQAETQFKQLDRTTNALSTVLDAPDELKPVIYQGLRAQAMQSGLPGAQNLPPTWSPQAAQMVGALQQSTMQAKDRQELGLKKQQQAAEQSHWTNEEQLTAARDYNTNQNEALNRQNINQYRQAELGIRGKEVGLSGARLGLEAAKFKQDYGDATGNVSPGNLALAQKLANGDLSVQQLGRMPGKQAIVNAAMAINPNWTDQIHAVKQEFKSGKDADQMDSITRILGHLDQYQQNSGKLGFAPSLITGMQTSSNAGLQKDVQAIGDEFGKLVKGGSLTEGEAHQIQQGLLSARQDVRTASINEVKNLMGSQFEAKYRKYKAATGMDLNPQEFFDQATQQRLAKQGLLPGQAGADAKPAAAGASPAGVPAIGGVFNGEKVVSVKRIK